MKLSEIKSGMVIEVLNEGDIVRYIACDIGGQMIAFNDKYTLGEIKYFFDENLTSLTDEVSLIAIYKIIDEDIAIMRAIVDDDCLETVFDRATVDCDDNLEIAHLNGIIDVLSNELESLQAMNKLLIDTISTYWSCGSISKEQEEKLHRLFNNHYTF